MVFLPSAMKSARDCSRHLTSLGYFGIKVGGGTFDHWSLCLYGRGLVKNRASLNGSVDGVHSAPSSPLVTLDATVNESARWEIWQLHIGTIRVRIDPFSEHLYVLFYQLLDVTSPFSVTFTLIVRVLYSCGAFRGSLEGSERFCGYSIEVVEDADLHS